MERSVGITRGVGIGGINRRVVKDARNGRCREKVLFHFTILLLDGRGEEQLASGLRIIEQDDDDDEE